MSTLMELRLFFMGKPVEYSGLSIIIKTASLVNGNSNSGFFKNRQCMYLANEQCGNRPCYLIRQSQEIKKNHFGFREVFDLGSNPSRFFTIVEGHIVIFNEELLNTLREYGANKPESLLEKLLFGFFPKQVQQKLQTFKNRNQTYRGRLTDKEREQISHQVHLFDRRRLYYLRYGAVDQSRLSKLHEKCCRPLIGQSRNEREHYFEAEEKVLEPGSFFQYIYAIFNLNKYFHESFAPWLPEALARAEVEEQFVKALCSLQYDRTFWQAETAGSFLHPNLHRYVWMFFDFTPHKPSFQHDFARNFMGSRRNFKWPEQSPKTSPETIEKIFGCSEQQLAEMTRQELTRLYRKKAMQLHPDTGGDAEMFISLTEIYTSMMQRKKS